MFKRPDTYDWSEVQDWITEEQFTKWIKALRSGELAKSENMLFREDFGGNCSFCALGVLAETEGKLERVPNLTYSLTLKSYGSFNGSSTALNDYRAEDGKHRVYIPERLQLEIANMNDSGKSFEEIATWLEKLFGVNT